MLMGCIHVRIYSHRTNCALHLMSSSSSLHLMCRVPLTLAPACTEQPAGKDMHPYTLLYYIVTVR
jgi:hypothetical protein